MEASLERELDMNTIGTPYDYIERVNGVIFGYTYDHRPSPGPLLEVFCVNTNEKVGTAQYDHNAEHINIIVEGEQQDFNYSSRPSSMRDMGNWIANLSFN